MIVGNSAGQSKNYLGMGQVAGISMPNYNDDYIYSNKKSGTSDAEYIEFYDKNGEMVATYSNMGWKMYTTKAEAARQTKMCMIYNAAWRDAKNGVPKVSVNGEESGFDCKA